MHPRRGHDQLDHARHKPGNRASRRLRASAILAHATDSVQYMFYDDQYFICMSWR